MSTEDAPKGIDVSKWQPTTPPLAGLEFLVARASIGTTTDALYDDHIAAAKRAGLCTGAYHFNWSTLSIADQVRVFLNRAGNVDFYFIDVEYAGNGINQFSKTQTREFIERVRDITGHCGLYMSQSGYYTDVDNDYRWVARWGTTPPAIRWTFWQYQGSPLDKNRFNGTSAQLRALAGQDTGGINVAQRAITSTEPKLILIKDGQDVFDLDGKTKLADSANQREDIYSPVQRGTYTGSDGVPKRWREVYWDLDGAGDRFVKASVLVRVDDSNIKPIPTTTPPPADCSAVEAELAATQAELAETKTELAENEVALTEAQNDLTAIARIASGN